MKNKGKRKHKSMVGYTDRYNLQSNDCYLLNSIRKFLFDHELTLTKKKQGWDNPVKISIIIRELRPPKRKMR